MRGGGLANGTRDSVPSSEKQRIAEVDAKTHGVGEWAGRRASRSHGVMFSSTKQITAENDDGSQYQVKGARRRGAYTTPTPGNSISNNTLV